MTSLRQLIEAVNRENFVVLDTETTGLIPAELCSIAILNEYGNVILDTFVRPKERIPESATKIHGIANEMVMNAPIWRQLVGAVRKMLVGKDVIIYNSRFDLSIISITEDRWRIKHDERLDIFDHTYCAMQAYAEFNGSWSEYHQSYTYISLEKAYRSTVKNQEAIVPHTAIGDCMMTYSLIRELQAIDHSKGPESGDTR